MEILKIHLFSESLIKISFFLFLIIFFHFLFIAIYKKFNLLDIPNKRKKHLDAIPTSGGIVLLFTLYTSVILFDYSNSLNFLIIFSTIIFLAGFFDDLEKISIFNRILLQSIACILVIQYGLIVTDIGYFPSIDKVISFGSFSIIFTLFCFLITINAFNFFDGIDGNIAVITISSFYFFFLYSNNVPNFFFFLTIILFLSIFIFFNFGFLGYKNFLGDSGSNLIGFIFAGIMIEHAGSANRLIEPTLIIWLVPIIYYDFLHLIIFRLKSSKSPYLPDENHIHHILSNYFSNKFVLLIILFINTIFNIIGYFSYKFYKSEGSIIAFIILFLLYKTVKEKFLKKL